MLRTFPYTRYINIYDSQLKDEYDLRIEKLIIVNDEILARDTEFFYL